MANPPPYTPVFNDAATVADGTRAIYKAILDADTPAVQIPNVGPYEKAAADVAMLTRGLQFTDTLDGPTGSSLMGGVPAYVAAPFGTVYFAAGLSKFYKFETSCSFFTNIVGLTRLRLVVNGQNYDEVEAKYFFNFSGAHQRVRFMTTVALQRDATNTISWEWIGAATQQLSSDVNDFRVLRVWA